MLKKKLVIEIEQLEGGAGSSVRVKDECVPTCPHLCQSQGVIPGMGQVEF